MGVEVKVWLWLLVGCGGIVVPSSGSLNLARVIARYLPQYITHAFFRVASTHTIRIRFVDHGRATPPHRRA